MESLERYEILKVLQENEAGKVSLLWHKELKCRRILKEMSLYHEGSNALRSEIQILQKVKAPFFPQIIDSYETEDGICLVEEYVEGEDLGVYLRRVRKVTPQELVRLSMELCDIVAFLHEPQISVLHLDIKPGNIVLSDNSLKLVDFGSAICRGSDRGPRSGTVRYAAPELLGDGVLSEDTDIWSIGKTFEFMRMYCTEIPKGYDRVIKRCLRKGRGYKGVKEISRDLEKIKSRKAIPSGDNLMAVVGVPTGYHGSEFALKLAETAATGKKTVLLDCNPLKNLEKLEGIIPNSPRSRGFSFVCNGVLIGKRVESQDVKGWRGRGYDTIVCDLGDDYFAVGDLPYRKVFLVGSLTPWSRDRWIEAIDYLKGRADIYAVLTEGTEPVHLPGIKAGRRIDLRRGYRARRVTRCIRGK